MYLPNYWTKLMLLSYLLVWLWSWYFWYFFPLESENMRSALVRFLPCLPFSFCASWVSSLALKKYQACAKTQNIWKSARYRLPNIKRTQNRANGAAYLSGCWGLDFQAVHNVDPLHHRPLFVQGKKGNTREVSTPLAKSEISSELSLSQKLVLIIGVGVLFSSIFHMGTKQAGSAAQGRSPDLDCTVTGSCSSLLVHWATLLPGGAWFCAFGSFRKFLIGKSLVMPQHRCTLTLPKVLGSNVLTVFLCGINWW